MSDYAKISFKVKRYDKDGRPVSEVALDDVSLTPEFIFHKHITVSSSGTTINPMAATDYSIVVNHSYVDVTANIDFFSGGGAQDIVIPAAKDSDSPGILIVQGVNAESGWGTLTAASGTADCEVFLFCT